MHELPYGHLITDKRVYTRILSEACFYYNLQVGPIQHLIHVKPKGWRWVRVAAFL